MKALKKTLVIGASSLMALSGMGGVALAATQADAPEPTAPAQEEGEQQTAASSDIVQVSEVVGQFAFTQAEVTANDTIKKNLGDASQYLCGARPSGGGTQAAEDWSISVDGAVEHSFTATFEQLSQDDSVQTQLMGCSCAGNPADGRASANAEVTGIPMQSIFEMATPSDNANTVVFTSADGYQVALPMDYVLMHRSLIVFDVNGSPISDVVGGTNQLWLGSTAASYFARDIVSVMLEERQTPPPSPTSDEAREAYGNLPNIGVLFGGDVR